MRAVVGFLRQLRGDQIWRQYRPKLFEDPALQHTQVSCCLGSNNLLQSYYEAMLDRYSSTAQPQVQAPTPDDDPAASWLFELQDDMLPVAMLPSPRDSKAQPTAVLVTQLMLDKCDRGPPKPGSLRAAYTAADDHGLVAGTSQLGSGKRLVLVTFYVLCRWGHCWHLLLQFPMEETKDRLKRVTKCLGQLGSGCQPGSILCTNPCLNQECKVGPLSAPSPWRAACHVAFIDACAAGQEANAAI